MNKYFRQCLNNKDQNIQYHNIFHLILLYYLDNSYSKCHSNCLINKLLILRLLIHKILYMFLLQLNKMFNVIISCNHLYNKVILFIKMLIIHLILHINITLFLYILFMTLLNHFNKYMCIFHFLLMYNQYNWFYILNHLNMDIFCYNMDHTFNDCCYNNKILDTKKLKIHNYHILLHNLFKYLYICVHPNHKLLYYFYY